MSYATFWQRFAAMWVDIFVFAPVVLFQSWLESFSKTAAMVLIIPMTAAYCAYAIYCHGRFGRTVGKHVMGIHVVLTTGEKIGWREAWLRSSLDVVFASLGVVSALLALAAISDADYYGVGWTQRAINLKALEPAWLGWTAIATQLWVWSEVVVMLFNKRRRALHDFIAGTVVLVDKKAS